jgi:hypothetical protein
VIPYARALAEAIPTLAVRLRRDFAALLGLIKAHALLHQATRLRDAQGRIVATIDEDYAVVRGLVGEVLAAGVEATVPKRVRETVEAVAAAAKTDGAAPLSITALARLLELDKSATSRRVGDAIERGYLVNQEERPGRPYRLVCGAPLPEDVQLLPDPGVLHGCTQSGGIHTPPPPSSDDERKADR